MTNTYHATPYDIHGAGFYFSTFEEFEDKASKHRNAFGDPVEEYEIQFIDGDNYQLFNALEINQTNLKQWFDDYEGLDGEDEIKATYLADDQGMDMDEILAELNDVQLFEGSALDYAEQYVEDTGMLDTIPENLRFYFDLKAFVRDLLYSGDVAEVEICGTTYTVQAC